MTTLNTQTRDLTIKAKKLRREGFVPGILFGREMKESTPIQFELKEAERFMRANKKGSQVTLDMDGKKVSTLVKDISYDPLKRQILSLEFQALVSGETVNATAPIVLINEDKAVGYTNQLLEEIAYKAAPADLLDKVEIDFTKFPQGESIRVKDLDINSNSNIQIETPEDEMIIHITDHLKGASEEDAPTEEVSDTAEE